MKNLKKPRISLPLKTPQLKTPHIPLFLKTPQKKGTPPGTMVHIGTQKMEKCMMTQIVYDKDSVEEKIFGHDDTKLLEKKDHVHWINVDGIHDTTEIETLGKKFGIHSLTLEDIVNTAQRPKLEEFDDYLLVIIKMLNIDPETKAPAMEQVSMVLTENTVITFQEKKGDVFDAIRSRIQEGKGPTRERSADYLFYRLLDAIVDEYFVVLGFLGEQVEEIEKELLNESGKESMQDIHALRRELVFTRQAILPLRDLLMQLNPEDSRFIKKETSPYLRDLYDHAMQASASVDAFRDMAANLLDNYLSIISHKMNSVMKVLTVVTSVFIPLTFVSGLYGMNFKYMPELEWKMGYPMVLVLMTAMTAAMLIFFRRKKWL